MSENNALVMRDTIFSYYLYDAGKTIKMFGQDMLEDCGSPVPLDLIERYKNVMQEYAAVQKELAKYYGRGA